MELESIHRQKGRFGGQGVRRFHHFSRHPWPVATLRLHFGHLNL